MKYINYNELTDIQKKLVNEAEKARENAYAPYYKFMVGVAMLSQKDEIVTGANFENAAGASICAERSAIVSANVKGIRAFKSMAIIARGENYDTLEPTAPCGVCRQMLAETAQLSGNDVEVILSNTKKDKIIITSTNELLPLAYGPNDMNVDIERYRK